MTVEQAAAALSVSGDTFHAEIEPELKIVRLGRRKLIPVSELERWLERHAEGSSDDDLRRHDRSKKDKTNPGAVGLLQKSRIRRGVRVPREVLISDLGGVSSELAKSQGDSYPGSSRQAWARWQAEQTRVARPQAPRTTTNAEEPLLERI